MNIAEAMEQRHSVRQYTDRALSEDTISAFQEEIDACNRESGLHIQLVVNEPKAFEGFMAHYGKFRGVKNYIAMVGEKNSLLDETCGYYGERLVLFAQQMGLNTCWVALTYSKVKTAFEVRENEKLCLIIALGYGQNQGVPHKSKDISKVVQTKEKMPDWFQKGVKAALLAPTAMNQQKFLFKRDGERVSVKAGRGFYAKVDLGIVKYHFEIGAGEAGWKWEDQ